MPRAKKEEAAHDCKAECAELHKQITELKKEIGDVQTMINLLVEYDVLSWTDIEQREERKREKLKVWSDLI